ncbi:portal protein [Vibrio phage 159E36-2a]
MNILKRWFGGGENKSSPEPDNVKVSDGAITVDMIGKLSSGESVTESQSLTQEAYFSAVTDIAETLGSIPLKLYSEEGMNRTEIKSNRTWKIFTQQPCSFLTMQQFVEFFAVSYSARNAFYAYVERNDLGNIKEIIPFRHQANIVPNMDVNGNVYYTYVRNDGRPGDPYRSEDLLIIKGITTDGVIPVSPIRAQAKLLNIALKQDDKYAELQANGITSQMALSTEAVFKDENSIKRLKEDWNEFRGPAGLGRVPIFENGIKPVSLQLTPAEMEALSHKSFSAQRVCSMLGVPLHRIGLGDTKYAKDVIPQLDEFYLRKKLHPMMLKLETALNNLNKSSKNQVVEFYRNAFYAGSPWRLMEHIEKGVKGSLLMVNEGRMNLGLHPVEGGDVFAVDNNNVTYGTWDELKEIQSQIYTGDTPKPEGDENV